MEKFDYEGAEPLLRRALVVSEKVEGIEDPETGSLLWLLGNVIVELSRLDEGIDLIYRELHITEKHDGENSDSAAGTHRRLGVILRGAGKYKVQPDLYIQILLDDVEVFRTAVKKDLQLIAGGSADQLRSTNPLDLGDFSFRICVAWALSHGVTLCKPLLSFPMNE